MSDLYNTDLAQNAQKTRDSSRFGTRKLAFYTVVTDQDNELAYALDGGNPDFGQPLWQDSNSLYYNIVRALQEANVELYYLGAPRNTNEDFYENWNGLKPIDSDCFMFAMSDDSDSPVAYTEDSDTYDAVETYSIEGDEGWVALDTNNYFFRGQPITFTGTEFGGIIAKKTYYIMDRDWDGSYTWVRISDTVDVSNSDGTSDYPVNSIGTPGLPVMTLIDGETGSMTATVLYYDIVWNGTAEDWQSFCCMDVDYKWIWSQQLSSRIYNATGINVTVSRCQNTWGVFPAAWSY